MSKASNTDLTEFGFNKEMFRQATDGAMNTFIDGILADVALEVAERVGSAVYAAATGVAEARLKKAEIYFTAAELYRRRAAYARAEMKTANADEVETVSSPLISQAQALENIAEDVLGRVSGSVPGSGIAVGYVETGPHTAVN